MNVEVVVRSFVIDGDKVKTRINYVQIQIYLDPMPQNISRYLPVLVQLSHNMLRNLRCHLIVDLQRPVICSVVSLKRLPSCSSAAQVVHFTNRSSQQSLTRFGIQEWWL